MTVKSKWCARVTQIKSLDQVPNRPPDQRNVEPRGYVRLRWKVGVGEYLECYEHRLVAGFPPAHVHHENESKGDNVETNLKPLSPEEHGRKHHEVEDQRISELYLSGISTQKVAVIVGCNASTVYRSLKRSGTSVRSRSEARRLHFSRRYA